MRNLCAFGGLFTVLILVGSVRATTYHWRATPERPAVNDPVIVDFWLENYQTTTDNGAGDITIYQVYYSNDRVIFKVEGGQCQASQVSFTGGLSDSPVSTILCDNQIGKVSFRIETLKNDVQLFARTSSQEPDKSPLSVLYPYRLPNGVYGILDHSIVSVGQNVVLECKFEGGSNNLGFFTFNSSNKAFPKEGTLQKSVRMGNIMGDDYKPITYARSIKFSFIARRGDDGWYQCHVVYDPSDVGNFTSDRAYLTVLHAPLLDHTDDYNDHMEANVGDRITFSLPILAKPVATAVWIKGSKRLNDDRKFINRFTNKFYSDEQVFQLLFVVGENDFGLYKCIVTNDVGQTTLSFLLTRKQARISATKPPTPESKQPVPVPDPTIPVLIAIVLIIVIVVVVFSVVATVLFRRVKPAETTGQQLTNVTYQANEGFSEDENTNTEPSMTNEHI